MEMAILFYVGPKVYPISLILRLHSAAFFSSAVLLPTCGTLSNKSWRLGMRLAPDMHITKSGTWPAGSAVV